MGLRQIDERRQSGGKLLPQKHARDALDDLVHRAEGVAKRRHIPIATRVAVPSAVELRNHDFQWKEPGQEPSKQERGAAAPLRIFDQALVAPTPWPTRGTRVAGVGASQEWRRKACLFAVSK